MYAEAELRKRAKRNEGKKTCYHILGELLCRSFNRNNDFPGSRWGECDNLVEWIRERYVYLYANLSENDFKTEFQAALDMIDIDCKLAEKLKSRYISLDKQEKNHVTLKTIKLEDQLLNYLEQIVFSDYSYSSASSFQYWSSSLLPLKPTTAEEKEKQINEKYKSQDIGRSDW